MSTKIKCLLLDDELPGLSYLKMICGQIEDLEVVRAFDNPVALVKELPHLEFDLCILDIEMPEISGLQVANLLNGKPVIFTTAYKEYAVEAFDLNAVDYVQKPIKKERLIMAIERARTRLEGSQQQKEYTQLNTDKGKTVIFFNQLCYVRTSDIDSRDKQAILANGTTLTLKNISFEVLEGLLPSKDFVRINKKELIAISIIQSFSFDTLFTNIPAQLAISPELPIGESYRKSFLKKISG